MSRRGRRTGHWRDTAAGRRAERVGFALGDTIAPVPVDRYLWELIHGRDWVLVFQPRSLGRRRLGVRQDGGRRLLELILRINDVERSERLLVEKVIVVVKKVLVVVDGHHARSI